MALTGLIYTYYRYLPLVKRCAKREDLDDVQRYTSSADLFFLKKDHIVNQHLIDIESLAPIRINVRSDFNNLQERIIPVNLLRHMTSVAVINTQYGQINSLLTCLLHVAWTDRNGTFIS